jgi:predicted DNA-binding WGR domain protein
MDLTRIDASQNVHRFYRIEISPGLFGDWSLIREWDRIGQPGQVRVDWFSTEAAAKDARFDPLMKKAKRKRRPRPIEFPLARYRDVVERMAVGSSSGTTRRGPYALLTCWA